MRSGRKPWWQQATALVTVSTGGAITGFNFVPGAAATMTSPTSVPVHLLALEQAGHPGTLGDLAVGADSAAGVGSDAQLRAAIVNVAKYYLRLAQTRTPAQMEALIWDNTSSNGADHGESCAAFASLTLELAAQAVGQQSWVSGGETYPWPLPDWADVRVDTNPASPAVTSVVADAQRHGRWHPVGDAYQPKPGDWVLFSGHVEVVTSYADGVLDTIGADSLPGLTVNAHSFRGSLASQGVVGFADNGQLKAAGVTPAAGQSAGGGADGASGAKASGGGGSAATGPAAGATAPGASGNGGSGQPGSGPQGSGAATAGAAIPGMVAPGSLFAAGGTRGSAVQGTPSGSHAAASVPGLSSGRVTPAGGTGLAFIPGSAAAGSGSAARPGTGSGSTASPGTGTGRGAPSGSAKAPATAAPATAPATPAATPAKPAAKPGSPAAAPAAPAAPRASTPASAAGRDQQAFINLVAPGAVAAQQRFGVPAAVTIAQAIEESAWGQSSLAAKYHNLFGVKGTGPAGSVALPTQEFEGGHWITVDAGFRVYHNDAESIADHAELLATSGYYTRAMADRGVPDAFANDLTGVYATDPNYGSNLIALMKLYNLYRFDAPGGPAAAAAPAVTPTAPHATTPAATPAATPASPAPTTPATPPAATGPAATTPAAAPTGPTTSPTGWHPATTPPATTPAAAPSTTTAPATPGGGGQAAVPGATPSGGRQAAVPGTGRPGGTTRASGTARSSSARAQVPGVAGPAVATPAVTSAPATGSTAAGARPRIPGAGGTSGTGGWGASGGQAATAVTRGGTAAIRATTTAFRAPAAAAVTRTPPRGTAAARQAGTPGTPGTRVTGATGARLAGAPGALPRGSRVGIGTAELAAVRPPRYQPQFPSAVTTAFFASAKAPLARGQHLYQDVAAGIGLPWQLLAAVDWMETKGDPRRSPVQGEKLGAVNPDGTSYATKSQALTECGSDLIELAGAVYGISLTGRRPLSVRALASCFAAFRWGAILQRHGVSAMEFPYSVAGLTAQHQKMHWPGIDAPDAPDRPGARFREPLGAVPVALSLGYPATV